MLFLLLGSGLLIFVIPMYKGLYHRLGPELFWLTGLLVKLSDSVLNKPLLWSISIRFNWVSNRFSLQKLWLGKDQILDSGFWLTGLPFPDAALFPFHGIAAKIWGSLE